MCRIIQIPDPPKAESDGFKEAVALVLLIMLVIKLIDIGVHHLGY